MAICGISRRPYGWPADSGSKVLGFASDALNQYNKHFGPYPYKKFNVCEAPLGGSAGGMEFAGQVQIARGDRLAAVVQQGVSVGAEELLEARGRQCNGGHGRAST